MVTDKALENVWDTQQDSNELALGHDHGHLFVNVSSSTSHAQIHTFRGMHTSFHYPAFLHVWALLERFVTLNLGLLLRPVASGSAYCDPLLLLLLLLPLLPLGALNI